MTEELKQKAEAEADKVIIGSGMDRASVIHLKHLLVTMYMQGATENGIQWHDLRKDPNDLPKKFGTYWVCRNQSYSPNTVTQEIQYSRVGWCTDCANDVIAWCEKPQFKK